MPDYYSILPSSGIIKDSVLALQWQGFDHEVDTGQTATADMDHSVQWSFKRKRLRFEVQDTSADKLPSDSDPTRRAEITPNQLLAADTTYWSAFSFKQPALSGDWSSLTGFTLSQFHMGAAGSSPCIAIRTNKNGRLWITSRPAGGGGSVDEYGSTSSTGGIDMDDGNVHDVVIEFVLNATTGGVLRVWVDQTQVVNRTGFSLSEADGTQYQKIGIYASGGIAATHYAEFGNVVYASTTSLSSRTSAAPAWPTDTEDLTGIPSVTARQSSDSTTTNQTSWVPTLATHAAGDYLMIAVSTDDVDTPTSTVTAGWSKLSEGLNGTACHGTIFYYGAGGKMVPAPSSSVTAPTLTMSSEQASAIALTIDAATHPEIRAVVNTGTSSNANPAALDLGVEKKALWIATAHIDGSTGGAQTAEPPGYSNLTNKLPQGTGSAGTMTAEMRGIFQSEHPSPFDTANEQWVAHTVAIFTPPIYLRAKKAVTFPGDTNTAAIALNSGWNTAYGDGNASYTPAENDIVLVSYATGSTADRAIGVTTSGYSEIAELYSNDTVDTNLSVSWKRMSSTPDTSVTREGTGNNADAGAIIVEVWSGVNTTTALDVTSTTATGIDTGRPNPPSITPTTADSMIIVVGAGAAGTGAVYTQTANELDVFLSATSADTNDVMIATGSNTWETGAFDPAAFVGGTTGTGDSWAAVTLALRPATTTSSIAVGMATETDTAFAMGVSVKLVAETDTSLALSRLLIRATGLATTTNTALALSMKLIQVTGLATETDTALALSPPAGTQPGIATETDTAVARTHTLISQKRQPQRINAIQGSGTSDGSGGATISLAGLTLLPGDCVVALVGSGNATSELAIAVGGNNGSTLWNITNYYADSTFDANHSLTFHFQAGTVDTQLNVSGLGLTQGYAYIITQYRGVDPVQPFGSALFENSATGTGDQADSPIITPNIDGTRIIWAFVAAQQTLRAWNPPFVGGNFVQQADAEHTRIAVSDLVGTKSVAVNLAPITGGDGAGGSANSWIAVVTSLNPLRDESNTGVNRGLGLQASFAVENDTAFALVNLGIGRADETDTAFSLVMHPQAGVSSETDTAVALGMKLIQAVGVSLETDEAFSTTPTLQASQANETDTGFALARLVIRATGLSSETVTALVCAPLVKRTTGLTTEADSARQPGLATPTKLANETDLAFARNLLQVSATGMAEELDQAFELFGALNAASARKPSVNIGNFLRERRQRVYFGSFFE